MWHMSNIVKQYTSDEVSFIKFEELISFLQQALQCSTIVELFLSGNCKNSVLKLLHQHCHPDHNHQSLISLLLQSLITPQII